MDWNLDGILMVWKEFSSSCVSIERAKYNIRIEKDFWLKNGLPKMQFCAIVKLNVPKHSCCSCKTRKKPIPCKSGKFMHNVKHILRLPYSTRKNPVIRLQFGEFYEGDFFAWNLSNVEHFESEFLHVNWLWKRLHADLFLN